MSDDNQAAPVPAATAGKRLVRYVLIGTIVLELVAGTVVWLLARHH